MDYQSNLQILEEQLKRQQFLKQQLELLKTKKTKDAESEFYSDLNEAAHHILNTLNLIIEANTIFMASNDQVTNTIFKAVHKQEQLVKEGAILPLEQTYCNLVLENQSKDTVIVNDTKTDPLTAKLAVTDQLTGCSFIGVPIKLKSGQVFGTLCAMDHRRYKFTAKDVAILKSMSSFFAYVLELEKAVDELQAFKEIAAGSEDAV